MRPRARPRGGTPEAGEVVWLAALPCALLTLAVLIVLGPPIGNAFLSPGSDVFWPETTVMPEPVEHARYLVALLGPLLLAAVVLTAGRWPARPSAETVGAARVATQAVVLAVLCIGVLAQNDAWDLLPPGDLTIVEPRRLAAAAILSSLVLVTMRRESFAARIGQAARNRSRALRVACGATAVALTAIWLLTAVHTDDTLGDMIGLNLVPWTMNEAYAVLDGRTPLVDFHAAYAQLLPYASAAAMALLDRATTTEWTLVMASLSGLALLAVYGILRRVAGGPLPALLLYVPFLAAGFATLDQAGSYRWSPASIFSLWPLRYAGPYLLAWLTIRHLEGAAPRRRWLLLGAGGLVAINNPEFGLGALAGTVAALLCARPPASWGAAIRLAAVAAGGVLAAAGLVSLLTLARAGELPDLTLLFEFSRLFGTGGWVLLPMPTIGLHIAMYLTFAAALVLAVVRAKRGDAHAPLTGMLAWSGVFGLLGGSYYVGRSNSLGLVSLLSPWVLTLALLLVATVRELSARDWRRPAPLQVAVLLGFAFAAGFVTQLPDPGAQAQRLADGGADPVFATPAIERFVDGRTDPGERVALLVPLGHRIAYDLGLDNVAPYSSVESMPTEQQVADTIASLRRERVHDVFLANYDVTPGNTIGEVVGAFEQAGYDRRAFVENIFAFVDPAN